MTNINCVNEQQHRQGTSSKLHSEKRQQSNGSEMSPLPNSHGNKQDKGMWTCIKKGNRDPEIIGVARLNISLI